MTKEELAKVLEDLLAEQAAKHHAWMSGERGSYETQVTYDGDIDLQTLAEALLERMASHSA